MARASSAAGVVSPNIEMPMSGAWLPSGADRRAWKAFAMPAMPAAALSRTCAEIELSPATSTTEYISVASTSPT